MLDNPHGEVNSRLAIDVVAVSDRNAYQVISGADQIERLGALLRGKEKFSLFTSIVLPLLVAAATVALTTSIQYISWYNSIRLQAASEQASRAADVYRKLDSSIGASFYSLYLYRASLVDLVNKQNTHDDTLGKFAVDLDKSRMSYFYEELKKWSETYDQMLSSADFSLDRPLLRPINEIKDKNAISRSSLKDIDCRQSMIYQINKLNLNKHSLKIQFAILDYCFAVAAEVFDSYYQQSLHGADFKFDQAAIDKMSQIGANLSTMANVFRCNALRRIEFLYGEKDYSIISPLTLYRRIMLSRNARINAHLQAVDRQCNAV